MEVVDVCSSCNLYLEDYKIGVLFTVTFLSDNQIVSKIKGFISYIEIR